MGYMMECDGIEKNIYIYGNMMRPIWIVTGWFFFAQRKDPFMDDLLTSWKIQRKIIFRFPPQMCAFPLSFGKEDWSQYVTILV